MDRIVGIGEYVISDDKQDVIKTFALASCVAITIYCSKLSVAGMAHIALPYHTDTNVGKGKQDFYYAETAVPLLIQKMCQDYRCKKQEMLIELFGGARSRKGNDIFQIGDRNLMATKKILDEMRLYYVDKEVGGTYSRTLEMAVATGEKTIRKQPMCI